MSRQLLQRSILAFLLCAAAATAQQYTISTIAGNGTAGFVDGNALGAQLNSPTGIAVDSTGKVYIADSSNHRIRLLSGGTLSTVAGSGTGSYAGDGASATSAELFNPNAVAVDGSGNLYIADTGNHIIRKVSGGTITLFAGIPDVPGFQGDNGLAVGAALSSPSGIAVDAAGNVYISDTGNNLIRKVDKSSGNITAVFGLKGTANTLNHPTGIAVDSSGAIYVADTNNYRVVKWADSKLTTIAGTGSKGFSGDGGPATKAMLQNPVGVAVDAAGNVYIADSTNSRIRKVTPDGTITTIAGNGKFNYSGDGGPATSAGLYFPRGVAVDAQGNVYIADTSNQAIRLLQGAKPVISDGGVTNAASYAQRISPGALATLWGTFGVSPGATTAPWPSDFNGVAVSVNGQQAPIYYVSSGQINFQVPWSTAAGTATVTVNVNGGTSNGMSVPVVSAGPGLFFNGSAAIVQDQDYSLNGPSNPAAGGSTIIAYLTGSGPVSPPAADGVPAPTDTLVQATSTYSAKIGPADAKVTFAGLTPGYIGLVQMNVVVPTGLAPGDYPLTVTIDGQTSNSANVSVK